MQYPVDALGQTAAQVVMQLLDGAISCSAQQLQPQLVMRQSVAAPGNPVAEP